MDRRVRIGKGYISECLANPPGRELLRYCIHRRTDKTDSGRLILTPEPGPETVQRVFTNKQTVYIEVNSLYFPLFFLKEREAFIKMVKSM